MPRNQITNNSILEGLFFGVGRLSLQFKLKRVGREVSTDLLLTETGLIKAAKKPYFSVGLGATLVDSKIGLSPESYRGIIEIRNVSKQDVRFKNIDDGIDALPDLFITPLGELNDKIEASSITPSDNLDFLDLSPPRRKTKALTNVASKKQSDSLSQKSGKRELVTRIDLERSGLRYIDIADKLDLTIEELIEYINNPKNDISLQDLRRLFPEACKP